MRREILSLAIDQIDPSYISEALEVDIRTIEPGRRLVKHRIAARACCAVLAAVLLFTTAFALNAEIRQAVIAILYPLYGDRALHEIDQGHRTGSFDAQDTLLSFLDRFDRERLEAGISTKREDGFSYSLASDPEGRILAAVETTLPAYRLLVTLEHLPYENTTGLWQVVSYQILKEDQVNTLLSYMSPFSFE